jgi:hypothetical protein
MLAFGERLKKGMERRLAHSERWEAVEGEAQ